MNIFRRLWLYLCDALYDLFHLKDRWGQETLSGWWVIRKHEWRVLIKHGLDT